MAPPGGFAFPPTPQRENVVPSTITLKTTPPRIIPVDFALLCRVETSTGRPLLELIPELSDYGASGRKAGKLPMTLVVDVLCGALNCSREDLAAAVPVNETIAAFRAVVEGLATCVGELLGGQESSPPPATSASGA